MRGKLARKTFRGNAPKQSGKVRQFEGIRDGENFIYLCGVGARSKGFFFFVFCERAKASTFNFEERHTGDGLFSYFFF
jgi:hypothetical protein